MDKQRRVFGTVTVLLTYVLWGVLGIYWGLLGGVNPVYILANRIVWSAVFMGLYALLRHRGGEIKGVFTSKKALGKSFLCGILITINWGVYIYAVNSGHMLDASLGYFIEPVLVGLIGVLAFKERPSKLEWTTFILAIIALGYMLIRTGTMPYLAIIIAGSFAVYGGVKKNMELTPEVALFVETLCMAPFALGFIAYAEHHGMGVMDSATVGCILLLIFSGIVTSVPLLLFNMGVKHIPYYFSGILMYINPTIQFLVGIFYFKETLDADRLVAFIIIWVGVLLALFDKLRRMEREKE